MFFFVFFSLSSCLSVDTSQPSFPVYHRKFGNPSPLGLFAFALTTFVLSWVRFSNSELSFRSLLVFLKTEGLPLPSSVQRRNSRYQDTQRRSLHVLRYGWTRSASFRTVGSKSRRRVAGPPPPETSLTIALLTHLCTAVRRGKYFRSHRFQRVSFTIPVPSFTRKRTSDANSCPFLKLTLLSLLSFRSYGTFWISFGLIYWPSSGILTAKWAEGELESALGIYILSW